MVKGKEWLRPDDEEFQSGITASVELKSLQQNLAEVTGDLSLKESEVLLQSATLTYDRQWAVTNWRNPSAWPILSDWADEIFGLEERPNMGVQYHKFDVGEPLEKLCPTWILAKLKYMNWCVNGRASCQGPPCFCLQKTSFMPKGCEHYPVAHWWAASPQDGYNTTLPSTYCPSCSICMRCNKFPSKSLGCLFVFGVQV